MDASSSDQVVKNSLSDTIASILKISNQKVQVFNRIEEDALNGYLVPSFLDFDGLTADRGELPEWTRVVFEKEFEKQKKSLDVMAKKIYTAHALTEVRKSLSRRKIN